VTNPGLQSGHASEEVELQVEASDSAGYSLSDDASGQPEGLWIDPYTGLISGPLEARRERGRRRDRDGGRRRGRDDQNGDQIRAINWKADVELMTVLPPRAGGHEPTGRHCFHAGDEVWKEEEALPDSRNYDRAFQVKNVRNPAVSPGNRDADDYKKLVEAIKAAEAKRQEA
jgi:hypothetical protein